MRRTGIIPCVACAVLLVAGSEVLVPRGVGAAGSDEEDEGSGGFVTFTKDHPVSEPQPDRALLYVVRPTSIGFAIKSFFFMDDEILGINRGSSYFFAQVPPGKHRFWSKSENVDALELDVAAGKTYFMQQHLRLGAFRAGTKLEVLSDEEGRKALAECKKHGTLTEKGRTKGRELVAEHKDQTQEDVDRRAREAQDED